MEKYAQIDESRFPLVSIRFSGTASSDQNFAQYLADNLSIYRHQKTLAIVFDARKASAPGLRHLRMQAQWLKENKALMQAYCRGTAYVIPQPALRAVLQVIFKLQAQPVPYRLFAEVEEAEAWALELIH